MSDARVDLWNAINRYVVACHGDPSKHVYGNIPRQQAVADVEAILRAWKYEVASEILSFLICDADMAEAPNAFKVKAILRLILGDEKYRQKACEAVARHGNDPLDDQTPRCHVCGDEVPADARTGLDLGAEPEDANFCEPCIEVAESVDWHAVATKSAEKLDRVASALGVEPRDLFPNEHTGRHDPDCPCQTIKSVEVDGVHYAIYLAHGSEDDTDPWAVFGSSVEGYGDTPETAIEEWKGELQSVAIEDRERAV